MRPQCPAFYFVPLLVQRQNRNPGLSDYAPKGRLDVGDTVYLAQGLPEQTKKLLAELNGSTVQSVNGDMLKLSSANGSFDIEIHRKYFCSWEYIDHVDNPCLLCGYKDPNASGT
jgi:hypothetical protein